MIIKEEKANRCGIFLYYDKDGLVDDYVIYLLESLNPFLNYLLVVCNGPLKEDAYTKLEKVSSEVLIRENEGFDVGGYREGIFHLGLDRLAQYDETIMFNYTFYGPLYPFSEMFNKMNQLDLDFWGITKHHKVDPDPFMANRYGYLPEHIQSHFLVLRSEFIKSKDYIEFITNLKNPQSYIESICEYESIFTKYFADLGYNWDVYVNTDEYEGYAFCPIMFYLKDLIIDKRCPIVKRRSFFTDYYDFMLNTCGEPTIEAYDYIQENLAYDLDLVWDNLLRLENMAEISRAMHLNYMLSDSESEDEVECSKAAIFCYVEDYMHMNKYVKYIIPLLSEIDAFVLASSKIIEDIKKAFGDGHNKIRYYAVDNYFDALNLVKEKASDYHYVCMMKVAELEQAQPYSNYDSWQYRDWENLIGTKYVVRNVISTFEYNHKLGLLIPPIPNHGDIFPKIADGWMGRYDEVDRILHQHNINVNIKKEDEPLAPFGGSFWIRSDLLQSVCGHEWECDEKVLMMLLPFLVQYNGAYTGVAYSNKYASIEVTNQDYMMRELNKVVFEKYGPNYHKIVVQRIKNDEMIRNQELERIQQRFLSKINIALKRWLPKKMYYWIERCYIRLKG